MSAEYDSKGCRCWRSEDYNFWDDRTHGGWLPNAACPHHGLLADFTERRDTGAYTVISKPVTIEPRQDLSTPPDGPECPPGLHSMFDPCPGGCLNDDERESWKEWQARVKRDMERIAASGEDLSEEPDDWGPYARGGFLRPGPTRTSNDTEEPEPVSRHQGEAGQTTCYACGLTYAGGTYLERARWLVDHPHETTEEESQRGLRAALRRAWDRVGRAVYGDAWPYWF